MMDIRVGPAALLKDLEVHPTGSKALLHGMNMYPPDSDCRATVSCDQTEINCSLTNDYWSHGDKLGPLGAPARKKPTEIEDSLQDA